MRFESSYDESDWSREQRIRRRWDALDIAHLVDAALDGFSLWKIRPQYDAKVEATHVGQRGLSQKCPDREAIPLCIHHHRTGPLSHHAIGKRFWTLWKLDRYDLIASYNRRYEEEKKKAA